MSSEEKKDVKAPASSGAKTQFEDLDDEKDTPQVISERNLETSPDLKDKNALAFWKQNFGDQTIVTNAEFQEKLIAYVKDELNLMVDDLKVYIGLLVQRVFWPSHKLYSDDCGDVRDYVDTYCLQFAVNTFGPWKSLFKFVYQQFQDPDLVNPILNLFHGRSREWKWMLENRKQNYLIRYRNKGRIKKGKNQGGLVICYTNDSGVIKTEEVFRKPRHKTPDGVWHPTGWTWTEKVPAISKTQTKIKKCETFEIILTEHKQHKNFVTAVMFGSAYEALGGMGKKGKSKSSKKEQKELDERVNSVNLSMLGSNE